jgi:hypothetical protein
VYSAPIAPPSANAGLDKTRLAAASLADGAASSGDPASMVDPLPASTTTASVLLEEQAARRSEAESEHASSERIMGFS